MNKQETQITPTIEEATNLVLSVRQEIYAMGANDSEFSTLAGYIEDLNNGTLTPEEAIKLANQIKARKLAYDYH